MLIFGHPWIESPRFVKVFSLDDIAKTGPEDILLLEPLSASIELAKHCRKNGLSFAPAINSVKEALLANALGADYVFCQFEQAIVTQKIANEYLFDTKVLVLIKDERGIETMARFDIDGVVFPAAIHQV
ncbi:hypothetical protein [Nitratifractor salsuginis]|uniref:Uncharacterized protein n=1 Tax=Nitratifractor salsuginis (strain DSM 16511 / JCM 12458 / E9I37-1) TaxID=749222 RepID=E6X2F4_NITSE|nr:hypothetical protein [Nitratifractor salsuginis]ADV47159.1 hypothetical protein Nitsa_1915 [Nitratifractor salsuginis DSM 16511]